MKILVMLKDFYTGGIQKSCVNFCNFLASKGEEIDIAFLNKRGALFCELDDKVNKIELNKSLLPFGVSKAQSKSFGFWFFLKRNFIALFSKFFGNKRFLKNALKKQEALAKKYDVAISFAPSSGTKTMTVGSTEFVLQKVNAKKKFVFMHSDFALSGLNNQYAVDQMLQFDKIFCVSNSCCENMQNCLPEFKDKIGYLYNICNVQEVINKSKEKCEFYISGKVNIISASRLSEEKGLMRSLNVFKKLIQNGCSNFVWHILGSGSEEDKIKLFIEKNNMQNNVVLYGNQTNPYKFIKKADLFYLASYHEAAPMVYAESMILGTPVFTTNTCSAVELVGNNGFICKNDEESLFNKLKEILSDNNLIVKKTEELKNYFYDNDKIYKKFLKEAQK